MDYEKEQGCQSIEDLVLTALCLLTGEWRVDYVHYLMDDDYWKQRLYMRCN